MIGEFGAASIRAVGSASLGLHRVRLFLLLFAVAYLLGPSASLTRGQSYLQTDGSPSFTTKISVEGGWIDASNGRLHLEFPMGTFPQRGGRSVSLAKVYDSNVWGIASSTWQPNNGGWQTIDTAIGNISYSFHNSSYCLAGGGPKWTIFNGWTFVDPAGTLHSFPITIYENLYPDFCSGNDTPNANAFAGDASGYYMVITDYYCSTVYGPDGTKYVDNNCTGGPAGGEDSNGNSLGTLVGNLSTNVSGNVTTYGLLNAQGTTSTYTVTTTTISAKTNFGQQYVTECITSCNLTVVQSIKLPDNSMYSFKYDCDSSVDSTDCSSPSGQSAYYGQMTSMKFPTGGTITKLSRL